MFNPVSAYRPVDTSTQTIRMPNGPVLRGPGIPMTTRSFLLALVDAFEIDQLDIRTTAGGL